MSNDQHFDDKRIRELLKKSIQQPQSPDFDEKLMEKIIQIPLTTSESINGKTLQLGKRYLILAVGFLLLSVFLSGQFLNGYFTDLTQLFRVTINYIFYGGMVLLIPVLFFLLDSFLHIKYTSRKLSALYGI